MTDATKAREPVQNGVDAGASPTTSPQTLRRRLMLGAAAVLPSVYTLTSGARQAATSSGNCEEPSGRDRMHDMGKGKHTADAALFTLQRDGWLRREVYYGVSHGQEAYCAMSDQAACMDKMAPDEAATGSVWIALDGYRFTVTSNAQITRISPRPSAYGLVFVNQEGTIATLDPDGRDDLYPVKETCWSSILGGRGSMLG